MSFETIYACVERLRIEAIGKPSWNEAKNVYEYSEHSAKVVAALKLVRAAHGVSALEVLRLNGLFIDMGNTIRAVNDATDEVYFLLENYPDTSNHVDQFVKAFFESDISGHLTGKTNDVRKKHIRSASVRHLKGRHDQELHDRFERIYKTFSGYVHSKYAHIMEVFGGAGSFNLRGVPDPAQRLKRQEHVALQANSVICAAHFAAHKLGLQNLQQDIYDAMIAGSRRD